MFSTLKKPRNIGIIAILLLAVAMAPSATSYPHGASGVQDSGCACHGSQADSVIPVLEGLPAELTPSMTYTLNISFTGGPSGEDPNAAALGGFHLWVSEGSLSPISSLCLSLKS